MASVRRRLVSEPGSVFSISCSNGLVMPAPTDRHFDPNRPSGHNPELCWCAEGPEELKDQGEKTEQSCSLLFFLLPSPAIFSAPNGNRKFKWSGLASPGLTSPSGRELASLGATPNPSQLLGLGGHISHFSRPRSETDPLAVSRLVQEHQANEMLSSYLSSGSWPVAHKPLIQQRQKSRRRSFIENMAGCFGRTGAALLSADPAAKARVSLLITETSPRLLL
ncbi:uncharacterized [Tachysurus ichikawai]